MVHAQRNPCERKEIGHLARKNVVQPIGGVDRAEEYKLEQRKRYTVLRRANASHYPARFGHVSKRRGERSILPMVQHLEISR